MNRCKTLVLTLGLIMLTAGAARAADKLTLLLDWFPNPDHAPLYVAQEKGYFAAHGLEVEMIAPADPNDPPKLVAAGKADLAVSYQPRHHIQVDRGLPLTRVATLVATPLNSLVVLKDGPVKSIADLKGRTIGYSIAGFESVLLKTMLKNHGLSMNDVTTVNVNFSLSPSLLAGKTDAVIGAFRNFELNQMDLEGHPGRAFFVEEHGVPGYEELIIVANNNDVGQEKIRNFVRALEDGVRYLINHPEECWNLFIKGRDDLNNELNHRAWNDTLPRFALRPGALDRAGYDRVERYLAEQDMSEKVKPVQELAVELR